jgi:hypothetical protein
MAPHKKMTDASMPAASKKVVDAVEQPSLITAPVRKEAI